MPIDLTSKNTYIKHIKIFENDNYLYFIGTHNTDKNLHYLSFKKIKFDNENKLLAPSFILKDILYQNDKQYAKASLQDLLIILSKKTNQKLKYICDSQCIFGFVKFFLGYYAILISETTKVGKIGRHIINRVEKVNVYPLFSIDSSLINDPIYSLENKYLSLFKHFDFTKQVFFSYSYDMTKTLQRNFVENIKKDIVPNYTNTYYKDSTKEHPCLKLLSNTNFLWNHFHLKEFTSVVNNPNIWLVFFIYGFFEQTECNIFGIRLLVTVIARRNRNFAGTRYLKRGINNDGNVANDVETEQILEEISTTWSDQPMISSFIHIRGSVPIYWYQEFNSILPKPTIKVNLTDIRFDATKRHFSLLTERYGHPCIVCNLTKKKEIHKEQETLLNYWYYEGVKYINSYCLKEGSKIIYHHYDLKSERQQPNFYKVFYDQSCKFIEKTNLFCFIPKFKDKNVYHLSLQNGVIRSNCVDCVDRTNVYQQVIGLAVLVIQLRQMGINAEFPENENEGIYGVITDIYIKMGHELSTQYAGSLAHRQFIKDNRSSITKLVDKCSEIFNTVKRYFNNSFNDTHKQATINLFLGRYKIGIGLPNIWEMLSDNILHRRDRLKEMKSDWFEESYKKYVLRNLLTDCENNNNELIEFIDKNLEVSYSEILNKDNNVKQSDTSTSLIDLSSLTNYGNNDYIISLEKYVKYKLEHVKEFQSEFSFEKDINSYCLLYVEEKIQIKNFYNFSFLQVGPSLAPDMFTFRKYESFNQYYLRDPRNIDDNISKSKFSTPTNHRAISKRLPSRSIYASNRYAHNKKTRKVLFPLTSTKIPNTLQLSSMKNLYSNKIEPKPKYNFELSSFEPDENDINKINSFIHCNINDTTNSEYTNIDPFISTNISMNNYNEIFNSYTCDINLDNYPSNNSKAKLNINEFSEDLNTLFNNFSNNKNSKNQDEREDNDYFVYLVDDKCLYKKNTINSPINKPQRENSEDDNNSLTERIHNRRNNSNEDNMFFSSSKMSEEFNINTIRRNTLDLFKDIDGNHSQREKPRKDKVKCIPIKILDNYYDMV